MYHLLWLLQISVHSHKTTICIVSLKWRFIQMRFILQCFIFLALEISLGALHEATKIASLAKGSYFVCYCNLSNE